MDTRKTPKTTPPVATDAETTMSAAGSDTHGAGAGNDSITAADGSDSMAGGAGDDTMTASGATLRDVHSDENETTIIDPADEFTADLPQQVREPTDAEREAIAAHLELRVSELATYVRAEAVKFGVDPHGLADVVYDRLRAQL